MFKSYAKYRYIFIYLLKKMKIRNKLYLLSLFYLINTSTIANVNSLDYNSECNYKYNVLLKRYSGLFMCPYLNPKLNDELTKLNACNFISSADSLTISFELDSLFIKNDIESFFINTIGISNHSILKITIE